MNNKKKMIKTNNDMEVAKIVKILAIILVIFFALWFVMALVKGEIKFGKEKKNVTIQYEEILAGESFSQKENEYYVLFFDYKDTEAGIYAALISKYEDLDIYNVDLSKGFNQNFMTTDASNKNPATISDLKVNGPTLIKISNKIVTNYIEGKDNIKAFLAAEK